MREQEGEKEIDGEREEEENQKMWIGKREKVDKRGEKKFKGEVWRENEEVEQESMA